MKIDRTKLKKSSTEVPADCKVLIDKLKECSNSESKLYRELRQIQAWTYGKCELYHWADVLDIFDDVLDKACRKEKDNKWTLACDLPVNPELKDLMVHVLQFTALLIEHSFSRHLYNSMEHLTTLLSSCDMSVVLEVLNLLYVFSKRSNFITRLAADKKQGLVVRLTHLAESWGGKENGFGLAECCKNVPLSSYPPSATTLHFEFYAENKDEKSGKKGSSNTITCIHMEHLDKANKLSSEIMEDLLDQFKIPEDKHMLLYTHIRLAQSFASAKARIQCVQARLQALSILVYSNAIQENLNTLLYNGLIEELVDVVELSDSYLVEIKAAALRTLTSIVHLDRNPKLNAIIDATGAASYHGFLPVLVRSCIQHMTDPDLVPFPQPFATALFSFLYHLASYENGGEALVSCGMMEPLLKVINWYGEGQEHITFVTRAVRVVDLITNLDMAAFQTHTGLTAFINRLEHEVGLCRKKQPFVIRIGRRTSSFSDINPESPPRVAMETDSCPLNDKNRVNEGASSSSTGLPDYSAAKTGLLCFPQRAALLKSMLNFLKKAIPDAAFAESIRHLMDGSLPSSLKHIISNAEYYGPSLFLLATDVVTVYVFQEPSLLSSLQDNGLTDVVLHALLIKDVPATREVLASLPNVFSALCLNVRGLESFVRCRPFDRLFKVLLSPDYLPAMRRRRSSDPLGDTASNLGNAMDELMRHQPSLRTDATKAIIKLLEEVCAMGKDPKYVCQKPQPKAEQAGPVTLRSPQPTDAGSSDEEEEEDDVSSNASQSSSAKQENTQSSGNTPERQAIPLMDYVLNVMKFVEAILSNNTTDDHCREFVNQKGLLPLMGILGLPNLPIDFPASPACQAVASVCKAILTLSREPQVLRQGLLHLNEVLQELEPLHKPLEAPGGSVLLRELAGASQLADPTLSPQSTPLLHALSATHAYIMMFVHVCRMGQTDIRTISVSRWGSELGLQVLRGLSRLYTSLVWESTVLLALCSEDILPADSLFGKEDIEKLIPKELKPDKDGKKDGDSLTRSTGEMGSNGVSAAMESLTTAEVSETAMEVDLGGTGDKDAKKSKMSPTLQALIKQIKPLLSASSRLGRALAELFGLLVKLCVGTPVRQRRSHQLPNAPTTPTPAAQQVATALTKLLANGLSWKPPVYSPVPKLRLTFLVCSVGFTSPTLFDEKKQPYHLMLQKFLTSGGQDAFFQAFHWALSMGGTVALGEGLENPNLPDGTGEFLDAWLMLVEKMVNPKTVLESPHTLPAKSTQPGFVPFDPVQYLIRTQKAAFKAVMHLWNKKPLKVYGSRMSESILAILCHIIKGENIIMERLAKEKEGAGGESAPAATSSDSATPNNAAPVVQRRTEPEVNPDHLQQLMDMGFSRDHCMEALLHTTSLEQATDYILNHPPPALAVQSIAGMELDMTEEDQMMRAIAMSLGENVVMSTDQPTPANTEQQPKTEDAKSEEDAPIVLTKEDPLEKAELDKFTTDVLPGCLQLLDSIPETVYRVCDLFVVVAHRNGNDWRNGALKTVVKEIYTQGEQLLNFMDGKDKSEGKEGSDFTKTLSTYEDGAKFSSRLHILALLFEVREMMMPCAEAVEESQLIDLLVRVLLSGQQCLTSLKDLPLQKWLGPLLLLIDLYEKVAVTSERKAAVDVLMNNTYHTWKWLDDRGGKWCNYNASNNKTIDDAYVAGYSNVRFSAGRRRYTVNFSTMVQINEETGNRRPIMLTLPSKEDMEAEKAKEDQAKADAKAAKPEEDSTRTETKMETDSSVTSQKKERKVVAGLTSDHTASIIRSVVSLIGIPVDPDTLHASLRLTLRLTRDHKHALLFAQLGGPRLLLNLTQASAFQGVTSMITLIFRHVLEEQSTLRHCMWKVMKTATSGPGSSVTGVTQGSPGSQELHYVLRVLGPAACRNSELFCDVANDTLRISMLPASKRGEEFRYAGPNSAQILNSIGPKQPAPTTMDPLVKEVLCDLLDALVAKHIHTPDDANPSSVEVRPAQTLAEAIQEVVNEVNREISDQQQIVRQTNEGEETEEETAETADTSDIAASKSEDKKVKDGKTAEELRKLKPLLPKSSILRLLSEIVKSYSNCAKLITQHTYHSDQSELIAEDCNVLAYILDSLLPQCQTSGDRDCPALSRVLIASIASCNHSPEAQTTLVSEVKAALQRALAMPESIEKHSKLQAYFGIITVMIESCPSPGQIPNQVFKGQQSLMNSIVKMLLKRGLVNDLARVPHSLDLSSPYMANTVNAALKPLENLSRIVNQPQNISMKSKAKGLIDVLSNQALGSEGAANNPPSEDPGEETMIENGQGEITIEDVTEQVEGHQDLDETEPAETIEPEMDSMTRDETELEDVIDQLLDRDTNEDSENQVLGDIIMETGEESNHVLESGNDTDVIIAVEVEGDIDQHDSQMITQEITDLHDDDDSGASGSDDDDNDGDHDCNDEDHDDDDDDDDEEECEEDVGSDMEADDEEYAGINVDNLATGYDDDFFLHIEDVFPPTVGQPIVFDAPVRAYQLPASVDAENGNNDGALPAIPPAPSTVSSTHPLLVRQSEPHAVLSTIAARVHRSGRSRGTYRFNPSTQTLHVNFTTSGARHPNPPVILQRLLGHSTAADVLQLTNTFSTQASNPTRVVLARDRLGSEDDMFEELFQETGSVGSGVLSCIPSTLTRWTEEAKVLDGDSVHDLVSVLKLQIIECLEKHRDEKLAERQEKKKKSEEEAVSKTKEEDGEQKETNSTSASAVGQALSWVTQRSEQNSILSNSSITTVSVGSSSQRTEASPSFSRPPAANPQFSDSEAVAAAERLAEAMVEEVLSCAGTSASQTVTSPGLVNSTPTATTTSSVFPCTPSGPLVRAALLAHLRPRPPEGYVMMPSPILPQSSPNPVGGSAGVGVSRQPETPMEVSSGTQSTPTTVQPQSMQPPGVTPSAIPPLTPPTQGVSPQGNPPPDAQCPEVSNLVSLLLSEDDDLPSLADGSSAAGGLHRPVQPSAPPSESHPSSLPQCAATGEATRTGSGETVITPEESSNITSSDAVTVHSTSSESTDELSDVGGQATAAVPSSASTVINVPSSQLITAITQAYPSPVSSSSAGTPGSGQEASQPSGTPYMFGEGVDPSFLAALPDNIRQEVIAEQLRLQRIQQRAQQQAQNAENSGAIEVNPEFLAALPPSIQEEVLAQQRAEQARLAASQGTSNPEAPVDPAGFIASLPTSLRQQVLSDMDDSMVAVLPADLAAEAQALRRELEERHRRLMHERLFTQAGAGSLSAILRHTGLANRLGTRYAIQANPRSGNQWCFGNNRAGQSSGNANTVRLRGRHLLDHEALTCLLVLLFVEEPKLNTGRLHRVLRNLCYHGPTRIWVVRALLSILQRTGGESKIDTAEGFSSYKTNDRSKRKALHSSSATSPTIDLTARQAAMQTDPAATVMVKTDTKSQCSWLSISLEAALGCRANVFQIQKVGKKHAGNVNSNVSIHPQASPVVCRHVLDTLISLAKSFPDQFLPSTKAKEAVRCEGEDKETDSAKTRTTSGPASPKGQKVDRQDSKSDSNKEKQPETDFWDLLVKLDSLGSGRKGKGVQRSHSSSVQEAETEISSFDTSPLGQLMGMLSHPVVRRSQLLTDRLLRLLGLVSIRLPDVSQRVFSASSGTTTACTSTTVTTTSTARGVTTTTSSLTPLAIPSVQPSSDTTKPDAPASEGDKPMEDKPSEVEEPPAILENQLPLAVKVLTSKACSEEGLEDATSLLLQLSRANNSTRSAVLNLLLAGGRELGFTVCGHIRNLMAELRSVIAKYKESQGDEDIKDPDMPVTFPGKGVLPDRFAAGTNVVVAAPAKVKSVRELQLPSMPALTSKTSSQQFFLRILKVIIQLRDAAREAAKKARKPDAREPVNIAEAMAELDNETINIVDAMAELETEASTLALLWSSPANQQNATGQQDQEQSLASAVASSATTPQAAADSVPATPDRNRQATEPPRIPLEGSHVDGPEIRQSSPITGSVNPASLPQAVVNLVPADALLRQEGSDSPSTQNSVTLPPSQPSAQQPSPEAPMEVDQSEKNSTMVEESPIVLPRLSEQLELDELWETLGECLSELAKMPDHHAVLILQPAVEAFFLVHAGEKDGLKKRESHQQRREDQLAHLNVEVAAPSSPSPAISSEIEHAPLLSREDSFMSVSYMSNLPADTQKFLRFAETHRTVLNQILRQSTTPLADGPFSVLVDHTRILDFDVKRRYFRQELERLDEGMRREDLPVHVKREHVFEDSFRELHRRAFDEWKHRFYIVFEGEEGQDAGGLLREWYMIISREIFNPMYALFKTSPGDRVTYTINPSSHCNSNHLSYFKFVGRIIAKAIYDNKLLECYFTRSFYKHIIGQTVKVNDMESEDFSFYQGLIFLLENNVNDLGYELMFSTEIQEFGVTESRDLKPNGRNIMVTEENKREYVRLVCQMKMTGAIRKQLNSFLEGFYDIIPKRLISIFNEQELELLISGLPTIDIDDLKANTEYHKYQTTSLQIQWFWRALRSFDQADRARFIQFVTGTSKVPLQGFAFLEGMNGTQKFQIHRDDRSTDRLPSAHTCFNQLDLPAYETYDKLKHMLLMAVNECSEGFGLA
ncbi:E3 ubiquitin-protein ligase HUWE1-like isoform X3 [Liolophura sinensis]|uniref:E3 ubiquitin-protein ligase HUWE1-like isoform X3 n=1 Tax=Liolophura sinensis TaxID=3198878 RepID=UPI00315821B3